MKAVSTGTWMEGREAERRDAMSIEEEGMYVGQQREGIWFQGK